LINCLDKTKIGSIVKFSKTVINLLFKIEIIG